MEIIQTDLNTKYLRYEAGSVPVMGSLKVQNVLTTQPELSWEWRSMNFNSSNLPDENTWIGHDNVINVFTEEQRLEVIEYINNNLEEPTSGEDVPKTTIILNKDETFTNSTGSITSLVQLNTSGLYSPDVYKHTWEPVSSSKAAIKCKTKGAYRITCSGTIFTPQGSAGLGGFVRLHLIEPSTSSILTGSDKTYNFGINFSGTISETGFTLIGYGKFEEGDTVNLMIGSSLASSVTLGLGGLLISIEPLI